MPVTLNRLLSDNIPIDPSKNNFTGNGSQTVFNLTGQIAVGSTNPSNLIVSLDGAIQEPGDDYTVNNSVLTFTTAPDSGARVVVVSRNSPFTYATNVPGDGSVTSAKIVAGNVTPDKLSTGAPDWDTAGNVTVNGNLSSRNLLLQGDNTHAYIRPTNSNSALYLGSNNTNQAVILSNGNFGIGTLSPASKLDVFGSIRLSQNNNSIFFRDANNTYLAISMQSDNNFVFYGTNESGANRPIFNIMQRSNTSSFNFVVPVGMNNQPINNCPTTAKSFLNWSPFHFANFSTGQTAPGSTSIDQIVAGLNTGRITWNSNWEDRDLGIIWYLNINGNNTQYGGIDWSKGIQIMSISGTFAYFKALGGPATTTMPAKNGDGTTAGFIRQTFGIRNSFNILSVARSSTGRFRVTFITPMINDWYVVSVDSANRNDGNGAFAVVDYGRSSNTVTFGTKTGLSTKNYVDIGNYNEAGSAPLDPSWLYLITFDQDY